MAGEKYPTLSYSLATYVELLDSVQDFRHQHQVSEELAAALNACEAKLKKYFVISSRQSIYYYMALSECNIYAHYADLMFFVFIVLDPHFMGAPFALWPSLFPSDWLAVSRTRFIEILKAKYDDQMASSSPITSSSAPSTSQSQTRTNDLFRNPKLVGTAFATETEVYTVEDELNKYLKEPRYVPPVGVDSSPLLWWKVNARHYPRLARCARDILAIPGEL